MATNTSLVKTALHNSIAEGIYSEIVTRQSRYYYFLGKTLTWEDDLNPPFSTDSLSYERDTRNEIITLKEIGPSDVSLVIPRYDWISGEVYDRYDDEYSTQLIGINLSAAGQGHTIQPKIYIGNYGSVPWVSSSAYNLGDMITISNRNYVVTQSGITGTSSPTHTVGEAINGTTKLRYVEISNGNGSGATAEAVVLDGAIIEIVLTRRGSGYTAEPTLTIAGNGTGSSANAVINISATGKQRLEDCKFYVMTDEFNVYQCLDNNKGAQSIFKPLSTSVDPIKYPDGYIWKFMYTIPASLRNKFITTSYIPISNSIRSQFYSNGDIKYVRVDQKGTGYQSATITVQGDGYLESDPIYLTGYDILNAGSGYNTATLVIDPPVTNFAPWAENSNIIVGYNLIHDNNVYRVTVSGVTDTLPPTHKSGIVTNGTGALEYIGSVATGDVNLNSGSIESITLYGSLRDITLIEGGSGYTTAPNIYIISSSGTNASAVCNLQNGSVKNIIINNAGDGYTETPSIVIGEEWEENTSYNIGEQLFFSNRLYTVTEAGTTDSTPPTHEIGSVYSGTVLFEYAGLSAKASASIKYGAGYSSKPNAVIIGDGVDAEIDISWAKSEAKLTPIISNGQISSVQIDNGGVGYTYANLIVSGTGTGAILTPDLSAGNIDTLQANVELLTVEGSIVTCPVISGGYGYSIASVSIVGDGTGATANAIVQNGRVEKIEMISYGSGYTWANIIITGNLGARGAKARAILAPYGGFGKNSVNSLFSRTLMFYSTISSDRNQGFIVDNDYRQSGIIKNPRQYNSTYDLFLSNASACWVISASTNQTIFPKDSLIYIDEDNSPRFRIITNTGDSLLVQSLEGASPVIGSIFSNDTNDSFQAEAVTPPTFDKYSGDLLYIDNRSAFTPSESGIISLRTVIRF